MLTILPLVLQNLDHGRAWGILTFKGKARSWLEPVVVRVSSASRQSACLLSFREE